MLDPVLSWMFENPGLTMIASLIVSALIILSNIDSDGTVEMPGVGRLGLAGILAVGSASFYFFATQGVSGLFTEIASGIFYVVVVSAFVAWYLEKG